MAGISKYCRIKLFKKVLIKNVHLQYLVDYLKNILFQPVHPAQCAHGFTNQNVFQRAARDLKTALKFANKSKFLYEEILRSFFFFLMLEKVRQCQKSKQNRIHQEVGRKKLESEGLQRNGLSSHFYELHLKKKLA